MPSDAPLTGIRVLEIGGSIAGPSAGRLLGDLGAEVFKVEPPEGDQLRTWGRLAPDGTSWWFKSHNRNKRLLTFDLRDELDLRIVRRLALSCDVVLENLRPGALEAKGLGARSLRAEKPELIYVSISGFGQDGPYASRPGFGNVAEAMGGLRHITGEPDGPPMRVGISLGDELAGLYAVIGALAALLGRARDGRGEHVDVALTESCFSLLQGALPEYVHAGVVPTRAGNRYLRAAPSGVYPTRDGGWLAIGGNGQAIFRRLCEAMGRPEFADDPKFATNQARVANSRELDARIAEWSGALDVADAFAKLVEAQVPAGPTMSIADIAADPQFAARGALASVLDDDGASIATYAPVPRLTEHPASLGRAAGRLGRDQEEVLQELAAAEAAPMGSPPSIGHLANQVRA